MTTTTTTNDNDDGSREWHREEFIHYLESTLIPDLKRSGMFYTAEDFETAVYFMSNRAMWRKFQDCDPYAVYDDEEDDFDGPVVIQ
ncbi:MAG: hypothetical protein CMC15_13825 [Flavobacteriaceae bacterium]|nr:hypothetical protein [Flavobacteriaceae bacterium]